MRVKNWMCDGAHCREANGQIRIYPLGGGANMYYCQACFAHENRYRHERGVDSKRPELWPQVSWADSEVARGCTAK
jgi:hypothetical protein